MATKKEQIEALLTHRAYDLATRELGVPDMSDADYRDVFTVTRSDIDAYVEEHGIPRSAYSDNDSPAGNHGLWITDCEDGWHVFFRERGQEFGDEVFNDEVVARSRLLDLILSGAGTGISFSSMD